jgi:CRP-like cAMP-binding protein/rhodanese-related sulfurtransferase
MATHKDGKSTLSDRSFFDYMPAETMAEIAKRVKTKTFPAGTVIFEEGDPGDSYYIIRSGRVRAFRKDEGGVVTNLAEIGPGDGFGELALLAGSPRTASVETVEETVLTILSKDQFDRIVDKYPQVALSFVKHISTMLLQDWSKLEKETQLQYRAPRISWFDFILISTVTLICGILFNFSNPNGIQFVRQSWSDEPFAALTPSTANSSLQDKSAIFVDSRPNTFYDEEHIAGALNIPSDLFELVYLMELAQIDKEKQIIVYGRTISSRYDEQVAGKLRLRGHKDVSILAGSLSAWKKKGYPVEP